MFHYWNRMASNRYGVPIGVSTRRFVNNQISPQERQAVADAIAHYQPKWRKVAPEDFAVFADLLRDIVTAFSPSNVKEARCYLTTLSQHALWCHERNLALNTETILNPAIIREFTACGMEGYSPTTQKNARNHLLRLSRAVLAGSATQPEDGTASHAIANYSPWSTKPWAKNFGEYGAFVREMVTDFGPTYAREARNYMSSLTRHVWWCLQQGHPLDRNVVLDPDVIAASIANMESCTVESQNGQRNALLRVSKTLLPANAPTRPRVFDSVANVIAYYRPKNALRAAFTENADFIRATVTDFGPERVDLAQQMMSTLTRHIIWCREQQHPLDREIVLDPKVIDAGVAQAWGATTTLTQKAARNTLLRLSRTLTTGAASRSIPERHYRRSVAEVIAEYTPRIDADDWAEIADFVRSVVSDYEPENPDIAGRTLFATTRHVRWCNQHGYPLEVEKIFRPQIIEVSVDRGMAAFNAKTRASARARLYRVSEMLMTGPYQPVVRRHPAPRHDPLKPYTEAEIVLLRSWADNQRTAYRRDSAWVLLALGLGAGLKAKEMTGVRAGDVTIDGDGVLVRITQGESPRSVPMLVDWEAPLIEAVQAAQGRANQFLFMPLREESYIYRGVTRFIQRTRFGRFPITVTRLRTTWIIHHLTLGTPLRLLMDAAGFAKPENLGAYIPHLPTVDPERARCLLRAAEQDRVVDNA